MGCRKFRVLRKIVADAGAVLGGQIEREVLSRLHCDLQAPLRLSRDRVGQLVLAPGDSLELVAALPVAPQHVPTRLGRGVAEADQEELETRLRRRELSGLCPHDDAENPAVADVRTGWFGGGLGGWPTLSVGEPAARRLRLLRV